jgi:hypothetical protein
MSWTTLAVGGVATLVAIGLSACQSSQERSAELAKRGKTVLTKAKGLEITNTNQEVKVVDTAVLSDKFGAGVVVTLKNESSQGMVNTPIAIDVRDAKGKTVFKNNAPGIEPSLTEVPLMEPGQTVDWVNDQVLATGKPASVKVEVGQPEETAPPDVPALEAGEPKLTVDPVSGIEANGSIANDSDVEQTKLILFAVARKDGEVVALGRGGVRRVKPNGNSPYHIFFIGDPRGGDIAVSASPTVFG